MLVVSLTACATSQRREATPSPRVLARLERKMVVTTQHLASLKSTIEAHGAPSSPQAWIEDKKQFLEQLSNWKSDHRAKAITARQWHRSLLILGTVVGVGGSTASLIYKPEDTRRGIAQVSSAVAGIITAALGYLKHNKDWEFHHRCQMYLGEQIAQFNSIDWSDEAIRRSRNDSQAWKKYKDAKKAILGNYPCNAAAEGRRET